MHTDIHCTTQYNKQDRKTTKCKMTDEWIKLIYAYIIKLCNYKRLGHTDYNQLDGTGGHQVKQSKSEGQTQDDLIHLWL